MIANTQPTRSIATMVCWIAICTGLITSVALGGGGAGVPGDPGRGFVPGGWCGRVSPVTGDGHARGVGRTSLFMFLCFFNKYLSIQAQKTIKDAVRCMVVCSGV